MPSFRIKRELITFSLSSFRKHFHYEQKQHKEDYHKAIYVLFLVFVLFFSLFNLKQLNYELIRLVEFQAKFPKLCVTITNFYRESK